MKKIYTTLVAVFAIVKISYAQNTFPSSGSVGIGTTTPQFNVEINAEVPFLKLRSSTYTVDPTTLTIKGGIIFNQQNIDKTAAILNAVPPGYHVPGILFATKTAWDVPGPGSTDWYYRMYIHPNGNIGIGTTTPDAKLAVNGTIHTKEVKVDMSIFPDYVFLPDYRLTSLQEIKAYIDKNHHLPEVPSASEVAKNGLKLGEMSAILLKKVEELTLYLIEKDRQVQQQKEELALQKEEKKIQDNRIAALEKAIKIKH